MRLRTSLSFTESALAILKLKRDRLAEELNTLLKEINRRDEAERQLMETYSTFKEALISSGLSKMSSNAYSIGKMKIAVTPSPLMNVLVPSIEIEEKPSIDIVQDASIYQVARRMQGLIENWLTVACVEASLERIAYELTLVNRKINAIEKVVVPAYQTQITYTETFLSDEELEDFTRIKHVKTVLREKKA